MLNQLKRNAFMFCAILLFTTSVQSQNAIGGKIGINLATWGGEDGDVFESGDSNKKMIGGQIGLAFQIGINEMISIQPELLYVQKGIRAKESFGGITYKQIVKFNYLEVPILVKLNFPVTEQLSFFANAGPSVAYAVNAVAIYEEGDEKDREEIELGDDNDINRTELSLIFGGGISYNLPIGKLVLDGRYLYGISNLADDDDVNVKNRGIGVMLGFMLPF